MIFLGNLLALSYSTNTIEVFSSAGRTKMELPDLEDPAEIILDGNNLIITDMKDHSVKHFQIQVGYDFRKNPFQMNQAANSLG